jgi:UDP-glucose 4-epimerase
VKESLRQAACTVLFVIDRTMIKKVLVTGASGFVGRHVALAAARLGYDVYGMGHGSWSTKEALGWGICHWTSADVTLDSLIRSAVEPDYVIHCAGSGSVAFSLTDPLEDFQRTVQTFLDVLEYSRLHTPNARIVLPSSASVYGAALTFPISINTIPAPTSPYGVHKLITEQLASYYARHFNMAISIVRLFSVYGVGLRKQLLWDACNKLKVGPAEFAGTGFETRDWIHVNDAANLLLAATNVASKDCPVFNGASGTGVTTRAVVDIISSVMGRTERAVFNGISRAGDPMHYVADVSGALDLGWKPAYTLENELENYVNWFLKLDD